ncbi:hypothetical protein TIFTF001_030035 [Ficus carica]|uniref:Methyltransferase type 11 domain-containing protein n=1 Tax=Ficus carica TaxID=3494 RepID=A0AA88J3L9_FICCA|nr:hypothetical protein TIFTF001_030035 [Ficus carica]
MSISEVEQKIAPKSSMDLVTAAQTLHWLDLPSFYQQVKWVLKKTHGVIAVWCYTVPKVNSAVRKVVDDEYRTIDFPFEPVDGLENTGAVEFVYVKVMDLDQFFAYIRSWSAYQMAKDKGFELLRNNVIERFKCAWSEDDNDQKVVKFPVHLKIGRVGNI